MSKILVADDEMIERRVLVKRLRTHCGETCSILEAENGRQVLELWEREKPDVLILDIEMPGINGIELAKRFMEINPAVNIIFTTGYSEYALEAIELHASGYLMKPITADAVQKEIDHIKGIKSTEKLLTIKCIGNFEVLYNGEILPFKRKKAKELLAVLVDRNGAGMTAKQICAILFPEDTDDIKNAAYLRQLILDLKNTLKTIRAEGVLQHDTPYYRIDTNLVRCDYISFLETGKPQFLGEYMTQYSWAEETCAMLQFKK
jgi:two-component SAPR family response regulator